MFSSRGWSYSSTPGPALSSAYRRRRRGLPLGWLARLGPLPLAVFVVGTVAWYHFVFDGFALSGVLVDAETGQPVTAARVWNERGSASADGSGAFVLSHVKPPEQVGVGAPGYHDASVRAGLPNEPVRVALAPVEARVRVLAADTGEAVQGARVRVGDRQADRLPSGEFRIAPLPPNAVLHVESDGYAAQDLPLTDQDSVVASLEPTLTGSVVDDRTGQPVRSARVLAGGTVVETDRSGSYTLRARPADGKLTILAPGYKKAVVDAGMGHGLDVRLIPNDVKAAYFTYAAMSDPELRKRMLELVSSTEINAVVIDIKGDRGYLAYRSNVPLAELIGANDNPTIADLDGLLGELHQRGVYAIARIVAFKDNLLARNGPRAGVDIGIKNRKTGGLWVDLEELAWVDAFQSAGWDYNVAIAREAIERGFDEVQFDYIRFPTDPAPGARVEDTQYSKPFTEENRVDALKTFLRKAHEAVNGAGGFLGIDTFGYTTWWDDDGGIGQDLATLSEYVDYVCPMVYPSTFSAGLPGLIAYPTVVKQPYEVVFESLKHASEGSLFGKRAVIRPWLQYFDDYGALEGYRYDGPQIDEQKRAAVDARSAGWMLWDPTNRYGRGGIQPKQ